MDEITNISTLNIEEIKEKIIQMVKQVEEKRFLKAIYISLEDYLKENEPD